MTNIQIFISINTKLLCQIIDTNAQLSSLYEIIKKQINCDVSKTHIILFGGQILDITKKFSEYKITNESQLKVMFSLGKHLSSRPPDELGMKNYQMLLKNFEVKKKSNDFFIFSLMSYNVCDIYRENFKYEGSLQKNLFQQLQPDAIISILNNPETLKLNHININIVLSDSGFTAYNENYINMFTDLSKIYNTSQTNDDLMEKYSSQINDIYGLVPDSTYLKMYLNPQTKKMENKYSNRILKFKCEGSSKIKILENFKIVDQTIIPKLKIKFYFVGIHFLSSNVTVSKEKINIYGVDYSNFKFNTWINMWTGEQLLVQDTFTEPNKHYICYQSYNNKEIKIV